MSRLKMVHSFLRIGRMLKEGETFKMPTTAVDSPKPEAAPHRAGSEKQTAREHSIEKSTTRRREIKMQKRARHKVKLRRSNTNG
jgi:hypothetical protein